MAMIKQKQLQFLPASAKDRFITTVAKTITGIAFIVGGIFNNSENNSIQK